jgi:signal transduction histidine kinase
VTDERGEPAAWPLVLREIARASGHELRNALNALVVNLEVVRSRSHTFDDSVRPFVTQSVEQAEQSVSVAEGAIALLNLVVGAIDERGQVEAREDESGVRLKASETEVSRLNRGLAGLVSRGVISADATDAAVILRIPEKERAQPE